MKKLYLIIASILIISMFVTAGTFIFNNRQVDIEAESNQRLEARGIFNWTIIATENNEGLIDVCINIKDKDTEQDIMDKCQFIKRNGRTDQDIQLIILKWETKVLDQLLSRYEKEDTPTEIIKVIEEVVALEKVEGEYPIYGVNKYYKTGDKIIYNGKVYEIIQEHVSQLDWKPDTTLSLYKLYKDSNLIEPWVQPQGAHDCYKLGVKVTHNGFTWENTGSNCNVYEPGVWGWTKQ